MHFYQLKRAIVFRFGECLDKLSPYLEEKFANAENAVGKMQYLQCAYCDGVRFFAAYLYFRSPD